MTRIIQTRFIGPTTHNGAKIEVRDLTSGTLKKYSYDYEFSGFDAHFAAAKHHIGRNDVKLISDVVRPKYDGYIMVIES